MPSLCWAMVLLGVWLGKSRYGMPRIACGLKPSPGWLSYAVPGPQILIHTEILRVRSQSPVTRYAKNSLNRVLVKRFNLSCHSRDP